VSHKNGATLLLVNSSVFSAFLLFEPVKTGMNTLRINYLMA